MPLRESMMGKSGHALEVVVADLFHYSGFKTNQNVRTSAGEVDVVAELNGYDAVIECKEYNPKSTATVTRDMISNVVKKAEHLGKKNAVLVTTKPPSANLHEWARQAGVILRSFGDVDALRTRIHGLSDHNSKQQALIKAFTLIDDAGDARIAKRREFMRMALSGKLSRDALANSSTDFLEKYGVKIGAVVIAVIGLVAAAAYFIPEFRAAVVQALYFIAALAIVGGMVWYMANEDKKKKRRRTGGAQKRRRA